MDEQRPLSGDDVVIDWQGAREANQLLWDDRAALHEDAYGAHAFAADASGSTIGDDLPVLLRYVPNGSLAGLRVVHLQCHIGLDTLSLARAGARVTGLDFSASSLEVAGRLADEAGLDADWVQSDVLAARAALDGHFDVVFTGIGAVTWLKDLDTWAQQVAQLLRPGGVFYIRDGHPMLYALDETSDPLTIRNRYFATDAAMAWDDGSTYMGDGTTEHVRTYEFPHAMSEIIGPLLRAGLRLELFEEGRAIPWRWSPIMAETDVGWQFPPELRDKVPCSYTLVFRRPE